MSASAATTRFTERRLEVDGFDVRYLEAGEGPPLCCLHGAGGLELSRGHELLAEHHRVIAFEIPGFGDSPVNDRSGSLRELAATMRRAIAALGLERTSLWGTSFGAKLACWLAVDAPDLLDALVLASPAAIRDEHATLPQGEALFAALYHHPERLGPVVARPEAVLAKQQALTARLIGPPREPALEEALASLAVPTLVLFGTEDRMTPPELGRHYRALLPSCQLVLVYDAAHVLDADRPEAFAATVGDFLARREQFVVREESGLRYP